MLSANLSALPQLPVEGTCRPHLLTPTLPPDCSTHHLRKVMADLPSELKYGSLSLEVPSTLGTVSCCSSLCLLTGLTALADTGQQGRAGTMCILPSTENPTQCPTLWLVSVYWLKFLAGQIAKPFIFTGVKRKGRKGEEDRRIAGPPKTDQVQRPNRKLSWKWSALHSPAVLSGLETCWGQLAPGNRMQADHQTHLDTGQVTLPHFSLVLSQRENGQI